MTDSLIARLALTCGIASCVTILGARALFPELTPLGLGLATTLSMVVAALHVLTHP